MARRTRRTDVHRPSEIIPGDYEYVAPELIKTEGLGSYLLIQEYRRQIKAHMDQTGGTYSRHAHGGNCQVCGNAFAIYTVLFYHRPTNTYIRMGWKCAEEVDMEFDRKAIKGLKRVVADARQRKAGKAKAAALLEDAGLGFIPQLVATFEEQRNAYDEAWAVWRDGVEEAALADDGYSTDKEREYRRNHPEPQRPFRFRAGNIIADIYHRLVKWGNISDKQIAFLHKLVDQWNQAEEIEAQRKAEAEAAEDVPTGQRIEVEGEVLTTRLDDTPYGPSWKMLIKGDTGWKVWSTIPRGLDVSKGDRVGIRANITASNRDPKFGFAKRPFALSHTPKEA